MWSAKAARPPWKTKMPALLRPKTLAAFRPVLMWNQMQMKANRKRHTRATLLMGRDATFAHANEVATSWWRQNFQAICWWDFVLVKVEGRERNSNEKLLGTLKVCAWLCVNATLPSASSVLAVIDSYNLLTRPKGELRTLQTFATVCINRKFCFNGVFLYIT